MSNSTPEILSQLQSAETSFHDKCDTFISTVKNTFISLIPLKRKQTFHLIKQTLLIINPTLFFRPRGVMKNVWQPKMVVEFRKPAFRTFKKSPFLESFYFLKRQKALTKKKLLKQKNAMDEYSSMRISRLSQKLTLFGNSLRDLKTNTLIFRQ